MTLQERAEKELVGIASFHPGLPKYPWLYFSQENLSLLNYQLN